MKRPGSPGALFPPPERGFFGCRRSKIELRRFTLKVQRNGREFTVDVTADGEGLVSHAGTALLSQVADRSGFTKALSRELAPMRERRAGHDPGRVLRDLAVMLADGGEALTDLGAIREQAALFGAVASDSTAYRALERIAERPELLDGLRAARKQRPRARLGARPRPRAGDDRPRRDPDRQPTPRRRARRATSRAASAFTRCSPTSTRPPRRRPGCCGPATPAPTPRPIRSRSPKPRSSRSPPSAPRRSTSSCGSTPPARCTSCWSGRTRAASASRSAST